MNIRSKNWVPDAIGICAIVAGLALFVAAAASADPIGLSVGALVGGGFAFGVLGCGLKEVVARRGDKSRAGQRAGFAAIVATPRFADATASEFDDGEHSSFAPVVSLTEAQVERQRAERQRQGQRATLTRA